MFNIRKVIIMTIERGLRLAAGIVVLLSVALGYFINPAWLLLTAFAGLNLLQSAFTNWCPMAWVFSGLGLQPCEASQDRHIAQPAKH
jgi:hypothetical protein